jgi:uncharacterized protein YndB with AHSA1/START domain
MTVQDRIEREILIDAPVERVWSLVAEPGWWIGDGDRSAQRRRREGDLDIIEDPRYGVFPIRTEKVEPRDYVAFRWLPVEGPSEESSTLVEFTLREQDGGTLVRVVESGFAALSVSDEERRKRVEGNTKGWEAQLGILRAAAVRVSA